MVSRRWSPEVCSEVLRLDQRAQGMPGARCTRGPVCKKSGGRTRAYRFSGDTPTFPAQWFYGLLRALPGDQACLTPSPSDMARARPVGPTRLRRLDADHEASEPRDFTVRTAPFVSLPPIAHGVDPALPSRVTPDAAASTASRPNVSDDPDTPLRDRTAVDMQVIWERSQGQFPKIRTVPPMHRGLDRFKATFRRTTDCMLCSQYRVLDWCGLVDVRDAPIATEFCVAEEYRDVPGTEVAASTGLLSLFPAQP